MDELFDVGARAGKDVKQLQVETERGEYEIVAVEGMAAKAVDVLHSGLQTSSMQNADWSLLFHLQLGRRRGTSSVSRRFRSWMSVGVSNC